MIFTINDFILQTKVNIIGAISYEIYLPTTTNGVKKN